MGEVGFRSGVEGSEFRVQGSVTGKKSVGEDV
jgi:hypothetical protein